MVNILPGPDGKLWNTKEPEYMQWKLARKAMLDALVRERIGNDRTATQEEMDALIEEVDQSIR